MLKHFTLLVLVAVTILNCSNDEPLIVEGQVVSKTGEPISDADIHFVPTIKSEFKQKTSTAINYSLPKAGDVRLDMFAKWRGELIETLVNTYQGAGTYSVQTTDSLYTNRLYEYRLTLSDTTMVKEMFLSASAEELIGNNPLTKTDRSGRFEIEIGEFAIGKKFIVTTESNPENLTELRVTNSVEIVAIKDGVIIARKELEVDEDRKNRIKLSAN
ncbi:MAG: hypothetical protein JJ895_06180 [Balneolaceae bacterium]|nr:hypothetical protein [Balneolaceae bacterium]